MTDDLNNVINQLENTVQRSQVLASQANQLNRLQTKQLEENQKIMDKSNKHLNDVEQQMNEIEKGFCIRLCCSAKTKKRKSKEFLRNKSDENLVEIQVDPIYSNDQLKDLDQNLQKLEYFNTLIDQELQEQIQTLNNLHHQVDFDSYRINKVNLKTKQF